MPFGHGCGSVVARGRRRVRRARLARRRRTAVDRERVRPPVPHRSARNRQVRCRATPGDRPSHAFYSYGTHSFYDQIGVKRWFNNQTGGAKAYRCTGSNGTGCGGNQAAGTYYDHDFTPINSVKLAA
ncbi:hypothetical protein ACIBRY_00095 [Streptomyces anulatus]